MTWGSAALPDTLLAKSPRGPLRLTLHKHCTDTEDAAVRLFSPDVRWGRAWRRFFKIQTGISDPFFLNLRVAALFHDIGKANEDFYRAVTQPGMNPQSVRHEHLSALILHLPEVAAWLRESPLLDHDVICAAVLSHHVKASADGERKWCQPYGAPVVRLYLGHPQVRAILARVAEVAGLRAPPELPAEPWARAGLWESTLGRARRAAQVFELNCSEPSPRRSLLVATKVGVIAADSAASGLVREDRTFDWIGERSNAPAITATEIDQKIISPRIHQLSETRQRIDPNYRFEFHRFQLGAAKIGPRGLVLAACGAGKTLAAWKWAEAQAREREIGKVVFLYPTRATATEGFRDYVTWAPEAEASLIHGTARYELDAIAQNPREHEDRGKTFALSQEEERLFSLAYWSRRFFSATVDQFLGVMEHGYTGLCLLPALADSAVIFDEVHSFDESMFKNLVAFLEAFDVPVLCMTATLPPSRQRDLVRAGLVVYPDDCHRAELSDLAVEEHAPRYRVTQVDDAEAAMPRVIDAFSRGARVLWVVNTVDRCIERARALKLALGSDVTCYHSRFRLSDRQVRHQEVVTRFKQRAQPAIAVTTQVCEMSLDLDADLLVTELAPVTSLVQRFGRSNRKRERKPEGFRAEVLVYRPGLLLPYDRDEIDAAVRFLGAIPAGDVSQAALAEALARFAPGESHADGSARLLESGYYATAGALRDIDERSHQSVLSSDLDEVIRRIQSKAPWDGFLVPVPNKHVQPDDPNTRPAALPKWVKIADSACYDEHLGYGFAKREATR